MNAVAVATLELSGHTGKGWTIGWFVRSIATIVLSIAFPPEGNALVSGGANKLRRRTIIETRDPVAG